MRSGSRRSRYATWIESEVEAVRVDVVQVEQQIAAGGGHHRRDPFDLRAIARRRIHQRRDVLDHRACDPTIDAARARLAAVASIVAFVRGAAARWPISMSPARTHARCSDQNAGSNAIDEPRQPVETTGINRCRRRRAERDAVHEERHLMCERLERTRRARRGAELLLGNDLDDVDAIEVGEDPGRERRLPRQAEVGHEPPHPPHPPPRRSCCLRRRSCCRSTSCHIEDVPHEDVFVVAGLKARTNGNAHQSARHRRRRPPSAAPARSSRCTAAARRRAREARRRASSDRRGHGRRAPCAGHESRPASPRRSRSRRSRGTTPADCAPGQSRS